MHPHCSLLKKYICNNKKTNATFESKNYQLGDVGVKWIGVVLFWLLAAGRIAEGGGCFVTGQRERESRMSRLVLMNPEEWAVRGGGEEGAGKSFVTVHHSEDGSDYDFFLLSTIRLL